MAFPRERDAIAATSSLRHGARVQPLGLRIRRPTGPLSVPPRRRGRRVDLLTPPVTNGAARLSPPPASRAPGIERLAAIDAHRA